MLKNSNGTGIHFDVFHQISKIEILLVENIEGIIEYGEESPFKCLKDSDRIRFWSRRGKRGREAKTNV